MKIAQIIIGYHPIVGGYGRHVKLISDELRRRGHEVRVITTRFSPGEVSEERSVKRLWNTPLTKFTPGLFTHLLLNDYDLIHVHGYPSFQPWITSLAHKLKHYPLVFTPHYHPFGTKPRIIRRLFDKLFGEPALREADRVIALTNYEKRMLSKIINKKKIRIIPNPVPLSKLKKIKGFKKKHGLKNYILFIGRLERDKGINYLIEAAGNKDVVIIGKDVGYADKIKRKPNVHLLGAVSNKELMMALTECDMLVMPSKYEAFGITFIEAMAYGKPVIGTRVGPVPSVIGKAGLTVKYGDVNGLRRAISKVMNNYDYYSKAGLEQVKQYDVKNIVNKLLNVYDELWK